MTDIKKTAREAAERIFRRLPFGNVRDDTRHDMVSRIAEGIADVLRAQVATAEAAGMERAAQDNERLAAHYRRSAEIERLVGKESEAAEKDEAARACDLAARHPAAQGPHRRGRRAAPAHRGGARVVSDLRDLIEKLEASTEGSMGLSREVARAVGWVNRGNSRKGEWFHPNDVRDGQPVLDSLHGTEVWREPLDYTRSLDAAITLIPAAYKAWDIMVLYCTPAQFDKGPALSLCIAALRAREAQS